MTVDFFVHPDWPRLKKDSHIDVDSYLAKMEEAFNKSDFAVLVKCPGDCSWDYKFSKDRILESQIIVDDLGDRLSRGEIADYDWKKFTDIVDCHTDFRVHGSWLGECVDGLAVQLFVYLNNEETMLCNSNKKAVSAYENQVNKHAKAGNFLKSKIRYGVVMASIDTGVVISAPSLLFNRYGNYRHQLIDKNSVIYAKDRLRH